MIKSNVPETWQSLQVECASILTQCGFNATIEKELPLVRGKVVADVYAEELINGRRYVIICECKYWKSNIPQHVIHSFRTIVADGGINVGYIITMNGFQAGAIEASALSNIELLTWESFLAKFEETWINRYFIDEFTGLVDDFMEFTEPFLPSWFEVMNKKDQDDLIQLHDQFHLAGPVFMPFTKYAKILNRNGGYPKLPLWDKFAGTEHEVMVSTIFSKNVLHAKTYQELFDATAEYIQPIMQQFNGYKEKYQNLAEKSSGLKTYYNR